MGGGRRSEERPTERERQILRKTEVEETNRGENS